MPRQCRNLIFLNNYKVESTLNETAIYGMNDDSESEIMYSMLCVFVII